MNQYNESDELYICRKVHYGENGNFVRYVRICTASEFYAKTYAQGRASVPVDRAWCSVISDWFKRLIGKRSAG